MLIFQKERICNLDKRAETALGFDAFWLLCRRDKVRQSGIEERYRFRVVASATAMNSVDSKAISRDCSEKTSPVLCHDGMCLEAFVIRSTELECKK